MLLSGIGKGREYKSIKSYILLKNLLFQLRKGYNGIIWDALHNKRTAMRIPSGSQGANQIGEVGRKKIEKKR